MTINEFASAIVNGGARPSLFRVRGNIGPTSTRTTDQFLIKAASLPSSTIEGIDLPYKGRKVRIPGDRTFEDTWSITVIADGNMDIRKRFETWSNTINRYNSNIPVANESEFTPFNNTAVYQDWVVEQLDRQDEVIHSYRFIGCWPASISSIELNYETTSTISEFTVELRYTLFEPVHLSTQQ